MIHNYFTYVFFFAVCLIFWTALTAKIESATYSLIKISYRHAKYATNCKSEATKTWIYQDQEQYEPHVNFPPHGLTKVHIICLLEQ
jgi:hypothetical protein